MHKNEARGDGGLWREVAGAAGSLMWASKILSQGLIELLFCLGYDRPVLEHILILIS